MWTERKPLSLLYKYLLLQGQTTELMLLIYERLPQSVANEATGGSN
jgi:hypothetical protein